MHCTSETIQERRTRTPPASLRRPPGRPIYAQGGAGSNKGSPLVRCQVLAIARLVKKKHSLRNAVRPAPVQIYPLDAANNRWGEMCRSVQSYFLFCCVCVRFVGNSWTGGARSMSQQPKPETNAPPPPERDPGGHGQRQVPPQPRDPRRIQPNAP